MSMRCLGALTASILLASSAGAQETVTYDFSGETGSQASTAATLSGTEVSATAISRGAGLNTNAGVNSINSNGWSATLGEALTNNEYYTFSVTNVSAAGLTFGDLTFGQLRSGTGPPNGELRTSLDSFGSAVDTFTIPTGTSNVATLSLASLGTLAPAQSVEFRLYAYGASSAAGTFRLTVSGGNPGVVLNYTPVPEPATVLGVSAAGLGLAGWVRRRRAGKIETAVAS